MSAATYSPKPDSLAEKVMEFFRRNPTEELTRRDMADKFGCAQTSIDNCLVTAVTHGYIATTNNDEMVRVWVAGPALKGTHDVPVFARQKAPVKPSTPTVTLPPFDPAGISIERGIAKPLRFGKLLRYTELIERMQPGDSVKLPATHAKRVCDWARKRAERIAEAQCWSMRRLDADNARVWRDA